MPEWLLPASLIGLCVVEGIQLYWKIQDKLRERRKRKRDAAVGQGAWNGIYGIWPSDVGRYKGGRYR